MKYIRTYEKIEKLKFKVGDYVRYIPEPEFRIGGSDIPGTEIFIIDKIDSADPVLPYYIVPVIDDWNKENWAYEDDIILVPEYEIAALKYNL